MVDLVDLVDSLRREVSPPGSDLFPDATEDTFAGSLSDAFWEVRLYGLLSGFEENAAARGGPGDFGEGIITPIGVDATYDDPAGYSTTQDLGRDLQQLIVLWAGWKIVLSRMGTINSMFRAKAGPVEYETQQAASVLKTILDHLKARIDFVLNNLSKYGASSSTAVFDSIVERSYEQATGNVWWLR